MSFPPKTNICKVGAVYTRYISANLAPGKTQMPLFSSSFSFYTRGCFLFGRGGGTLRIVVSFSFFNEKGRTAAADAESINELKPCIYPNNFVLGYFGSTTAAVHRGSRELQCFQIVPFSSHEVSMVQWLMFEIYLRTAIISVLTLTNVPSPRQYVPVFFFIVSPSCFAWFICWFPVTLGTTSAAAAALLMLLCYYSATTATTTAAATI